ncbi:MAG: hypothetical protein CL609_13240 [Anaerolineaceae bacterium]|nr:hypothetical protein [Anaerolineaceae bacterium]
MLFSIMILLITISCNLPISKQERSQTKGTDKFVLGDQIEVFNGTIDAKGGTIDINQTDGDMNGFQLDVPEKAFLNSTPIRISYQSVNGHPWGENFIPISPLIEVDLIDIQPLDYLTLTIPVDVPEGFFAIPFHVDLETGELEAVIVTGEDDHSISFITNHFSAFIVSMVSEIALTQDFETSFMQGRDNFRFSNAGSSVTKTGECAGQSLAALYFNDQKTGEPLYESFDGYNGILGATPDFWQDDVLVYKLTALAQLEYKHGGPQTINYWIQLQNNQPFRTYFTISYLMLLTGKPQLVAITNESSGHALIVYKKVGSDLYVSDPNLPLSTNQILHFDLQNHTFDPYITSSRVGGGVNTYQNIFFLPKKDAISWPILGNLWNEVLNGQFSTDPFPVLNFKVIDKNDYGEEQPAVDLNQTYQTRNVLVDIFHPNLSFPARLSVFTHESDGSVRLFKQAALPDSVRLPLYEGDNFYGFLIEEDLGGGDYVWAGFEWVNIIRTEYPEQPEDNPVTSEKLTLQECDMTPYLSYLYEEPTIMRLTNSDCSYICSSNLLVSQELTQDISLFYYYSETDRVNPPNDRWVNRTISPGEETPLFYYNVGINNANCAWSTKNVLQIGAIRDDPGCLWMMKEIGYDPQRIGEYALQWFAPDNPCP